MSVIASCHCGGTRIEVPTAPQGATACTCSYCTKSGGLWASYPLAAPKILSDDFGAVYSASDGINQHHFCSRCGCQTYGTTPDWTMAHIDNPVMPTTRRFSLNVKLLDDFALIAAIPVTAIDGRNLW